MTLRGRRNYNIVTIRATGSQMNNNLDLKESNELTLGI